MDQDQHLHQLAATHLLQHTLRSLCTTQSSQWIYAVFWRILPRNYPPPKWDLPGSIYDRSRGNRRNWILAWEDGFCNFGATCGEGSSASRSSEMLIKGLQPDLFFKMSHEIYNFGEGLIGKVAADHGHKWVFKEPSDQDAALPSQWHTPFDLYPRTWEAQFQSGIETIALIAVREGVVQLGSVNKVNEDLNYVLILRKKFSYLENIPGVFLPHPSVTAAVAAPTVENWPFQHFPAPRRDPFGQLSPPLGIVPSLSSLEALLSKLPSVGSSVSPPSGPLLAYYGAPSASTEGIEATKEIREEEGHRDDREGEGGGFASNLHNAHYYGSYMDKPNEGF